MKPRFFPTVVLVPLLAAHPGFLPGGRAARAQEAEPLADVRNESEERLLLLLPHSAVLLELQLTIDGQPFRSHRRQMVERMLAAADQDHDGRTTWEEAIRCREFELGGLRYLARHRPQSFQRRLRLLDEDEDREVDAGEAHRLLRLYAGDPPVFSIMMFGASASQVWDAGILELIDQDQDHVLTRQEIADAPQRMEKRDINLNEILDRHEIPRVAVSPNRLRAATHLIRIGAESDWSAIRDEFAARLFNEERADPLSSPLESLVLLLDEDRDGSLSAHELRRLAEIQPQLRFEVNLGETGLLPAGCRLSHTGSGVDVAALRIRRDGRAVSLEHDGLNLHLVPRNSEFLERQPAIAAETMKYFDRNRDGRLERAEVVEDSVSHMAETFELWDDDADGQVDRRELIKALTMYGAVMPQRSLPRFAQPSGVMDLNRIVLALSVDGNSVFRWLDVNGDQSLGLRELRRCDERLAACDRNGDGRITRPEIPATVLIHVARGPFISWTTPSFGFSVSVPAADGPGWFTRMDRNGDGDVSRREFLGSPEQFRALDTNADDFIDVDEAARDRP